MSDSDDEHERKRQKKEKKKKDTKKDREKKPKLHQLVGYTNDSNPFGDTNLHQQFVWKKKTEKEGLPKVSKSDRAERDQHFYDEIEKVRRRRSEREAEQEEQERLRSEEARLREAEQYADWHQKEETFHLEQARIRSKIRLVEGREKPIDILAKNILLLAKEGEVEEKGSKVNVRESREVEEKGSKKTADTSSLEVELRDPCSIFEGLEVDELKELLGDIGTYQELEGEGPNREFWRALEVVCQREIEVATSSESRGAGVHSSVMQELTASFAGKAPRELEAVRADMAAKLDANDGSLDVEFWEAVLAHLAVQRARADVQEFHQEMLQSWLQVIEQKQAAAKQYRAEHPEEVQAAEEAAAAAAASAAQAKVGLAGADASAEASEMARAAAARGLDDLEEEMGLTDEVSMTKQSYWWQDKYRPRKPRYFNRVRTGYEWNKYNQTHYDHDNPPPKTVQGYKFSIFYPDLIDRTVTPRYICEPADSKEFMILRFTGGPPYEDVAFKLVNREWEFGRKAGFRASFERGVLSVFFNFKRHRYRK